MSESPIIKNPTEGENSPHGSELSITPPLNDKPDTGSQGNIENKQEQSSETNESLQTEKSNIIEDTNVSFSNSTVRRLSKEIIKPMEDIISPEDNGEIRSDSLSQRRESGSTPVSEKIPVTSGTIEISSKREEILSDTHEVNPMNTECLSQIKILSPIVAKDHSDFDDSELGIVGPATAAGDVLNADELVDPPKDEEVECHVAEWIEQSLMHNSQSKIMKNTPKGTTPSALQLARKSQRIVTSIIKRSIKCLNKMHAMDCGTTSSIGNGEDMNEKKMDDDINDSPRVPQNRQNGAALPEETATTASAATGRIKIERLSSLCVGDAAAAPTVKKESHSETEEDVTEIRKTKTNGKEVMRKRRSNDTTFSSNGNPKRICFEQRERYIDSLVDCERIGAEELATRADELRAEVQALDELARVKEMEWNEILSMRKLKEEAYLRLERKRQVMNFLESDNGQVSDNLPPASLSLLSDWEESGRRRNQELHDNQESLSASKMINDEKFANRSQSETMQEDSHRMMEDDLSRVMIKRDGVITTRHQKSQRNASSATSSKLSNDNGRKQRRSIDQSMESRHIGEGRQGPTVDVRSIIADYRLRHPEMVPRRGRRMRNSVNIGLGAGGAMVDTSHGDSRPSSTDSCKSNTNTSDTNNTMSFKDVLVQFAKLSQQQGEPVKTPQNYPDVTLHPVAPSPTVMNTSSTPQQAGSLLHGILTKSQSPRPTTFSPTLARLLTAPERDRNTPPSGSVGQHQTTQAQQFLQSYQGSNSVSITDLLSSSKARTEITITPVVNTAMPSTHTNNVVNVDDVEEENSLVEERDTRRSASARDNREDRDTPPRCQGCHERAAQFVCAGCGNQWYCSRECQVSAWDEHSEVCSG